MEALGAEFNGERLRSPEIVWLVALRSSLILFLGVLQILVEYWHGMIPIVVEDTRR